MLALPGRLRRQLLTSLRFPERALLTTEGHGVTARPRCTRLTGFPEGALDATRRGRVEGTPPVLTSSSERQRIHESGEDTTVGTTHTATSSRPTRLVASLVTGRPLTPTEVPRSQPEAQSEETEEVDTATPIQTLGGNHTPGEVVRRRLSQSLIPEDEDSDAARVVSSLLARPFISHPAIVRLVRAGLIARLRESEVRVVALLATSVARLVDRLLPYPVFLVLLVSEVALCTG